MNTRILEKQRVGLLLDPVFERHDTGSWHPERAERLEYLRKKLAEEGLDSRCVKIEPVEADRKNLLSVHSSQYLDRLDTACSAGKNFIDTPDSAICPESFKVAKLAAGGVIKAADLVAAGELDSAFCAVRPPGHHAEREFSMGFCLLNNVALATMRLKMEHGFGRIAIVDWDVHHGNGTQHIFEEDPGVLYVSLHQSPETLYPGSGYSGERGRDAGLGTTLNIPFAPGTRDKEYLEVFDKQALGLIEKFQPEFILVSAGYDGHAEDSLASLSLSRSAYEGITARVVGLARQFSGGRLVAVLEGGYNLDVLAQSVSHLLKTLLGDETL